MAIFRRNKLEELELEETVIEIISRRGADSETGDGYIGRGVIYGELGKSFPRTHLRTLDGVLRALVKKGKIEAHEDNWYKRRTVRLWRIPVHK